MHRVLGNLKPWPHSGESSGENVAFTARREKNPPESESLENVDSPSGLNYNLTRSEVNSSGINISVVCAESTEGKLGVFLRLASVVRWKPGSKSF